MGRLSTNYENLSLITYCNVYVNFVIYYVYFSYLKYHINGHHKFYHFINSISMTHNKINLEIINKFNQNHSICSLVYVFCTTYFVEVPYKRDELLWSEEPSSLVIFWWASSLDSTTDPLLLYSLWYTYW